MGWGGAIGAIGAWDIYLRQHGVSDTVPMPFRPTTKRQSKCPSCGSREFREHHGQTVCAYCRGTA